MKTLQKQYFNKYAFNNFSECVLKAILVKQTYIYTNTLLTYSDHLQRTDNSTNTIFEYIKTMITVFK